MRGRRALALCLIGLIAAVNLPRGEVPDELKFSHALHGEAEVECAACHVDIGDSMVAADNHRPGMNICGDCHDVEDPDTCSECHTNVDAAATWVPPPYPADRFSHKAHVDSELSCSICHGDATVSEPILPDKALCRSCHETTEAYADCRICHSGAELRPVSHDTGWLNYHALVAHDDPNSCSNCHTQSHCHDCHAADNLEPRTHPLDFAFRHANEARANELACLACHLEPEFCSSCHAAERILPGSHSRVDWLRQSDGGQHAIEGLFQIESCIACHDDAASAPTCARCHGD